MDGAADPEQFILKIYKQIFAVIQNLKERNMYHVQQAGNRIPTEIRV